MQDSKKSAAPLRAFVLGAGLGKRLRPLTESLPKPLVPLLGRPLITYAFDHLIATGVRSFVVNTHHAAEAYADAFADACYRGRPITFRHEPVLLETAGGIANARDLLDGDAPFLVYNGDIFTDISLQEAIDQHRSSGAMVTMILRREGQNLNVGFDPQTKKITAIRSVLGEVKMPCQFTGIYVVDPAFFAELEPGEKKSVIPIFLRLIAAGAGLEGYLAESGDWLDLGDRNSYLEAHTRLLGATPMIDEDATVDPTAMISGASVVAAGCQVGAGAVVTDSVLWQGAEISSRAHLSRCVVRSGKVVTGRHVNVDF